MKRRSFIGGLAACIAARRAPALCLNLRGAMMASGGGGWQNPYITDGLIAMWDGEWNAGGGVHDAAAPVWKDLVDGNDFANFVSDVSFGDDFIRLPAQFRAATFNGIATSDISTIECVVGLSAWNGLVLAVLSSGSTSNVQRWIGFRANKTFNFGNGHVCAAFTAMQGERFYCAGTYSGDSTSLYYNGSPATPLGPGMNWGGSLYGVPSLMTGGSTLSSSDIYSIRIYTRALTASEIAHNYAIDKARFNLP